MPRVVPVYRFQEVHHSSAAGHYQNTQKRFRELLFDYHDPVWVEARLNETEIRNLTHFGYGVKGWALAVLAFFGGMPYLATTLFLLRRRHGADWAAILLPPKAA